MSLGYNPALYYIAEHPALVLIATSLVLLSNSLLSALLLYSRLLHFNWEESFMPAHCWRIPEKIWHISLFTLAHSMGLIDTPFLKRNHCYYGTYLSFIYHVDKKIFGDFCQVSKNSITICPIKLVYAKKKPV